MGACRAISIAGTAASTTCNVGTAPRQSSYASTTSDCITFSVKSYKYEPLGTAFSTSIGDSSIGTCRNLSSGERITSNGRTGFE